MEQEEQLNKIDDMSRKTNLYRESTVTNAEKIEPLMTQMEQWSILSNVLSYIQHDKHVGHVPISSLRLNATKRHLV